MHCNATLRHYGHRAAKIIRATYDEKCADLIRIEVSPSTMGRNLEMEIKTTGGTLLGEVLIGPATASYFSRYKPLNGGEMVSQQHQTLTQAVKAAVAGDLK